MLSRTNAIILAILISALLCGCAGGRSASPGGGAFTFSTNHPDTGIPRLSEPDVNPAGDITTPAAVTTVETPVETTGETVAETAFPPQPEPPGDGDIVPSVLMYHLILEEPYNDSAGLFVRPADFASQLDMINNSGCKYLFADDYRLTDTPSVVLTFDDGYEDNYTEMFPILRGHSALATVFLITDLIGTDGYLSEEQIREMAQSGSVRFGCHTASHPNLSRLTPEEARTQFERSVSEIERITGQAVASMAYPAGKYNDETIAVASEFFIFAYTTASPDGNAPDNPLLIPRHRVPRDIGERGYSAFLP